MTAPELLAVARERSIRLTPVGDTLRVEAPRGAVTPELRQALAERKPDLLALLRDTCPTCGTTAGEVAAVRARRELAAAAVACDDHACGCPECRPTKLERCPVGEDLQSRYFDAWARWLAAVGDDPRRGGE